MEHSEREDITPTGGITQGDNHKPIADVPERKEKLTQILRNSDAFPALIKTGHVISAIDVLNRMDGLYSVPFGFNDNRVINIICDAETKDLIEHIGERTMLLPISHAESPFNPGTMPINSNIKGAVIEHEKAI